MTEITLRSPLGVWWGDADAAYPSYPYNLAAWTPIGEIQYQSQEGAVIKHPFSVYRSRKSGNAATRKVVVTKEDVEIEVTLVDVRAASLARVWGVDVTIANNRTRFTVTEQTTEEIEPKSLFLVSERAPHISVLIQRAVLITRPTLQFSRYKTPTYKLVFLALPNAYGELFSYEVIS